jgi:hypothetical protein
MVRRINYAGLESMLGRDDVCDEAVRDSIPLRTPATACRLCDQVVQMKSKDASELTTVPVCWTRRAL